MRYCNILKGVIILHKTVHELHQRHQNGLILKTDFEKAYDKVKWPFFLNTTNERIFTKWIAWVECFYSIASAALINNDVDHVFQTKKCLKQGDHLSPLLFNIVANSLVVLIINRAKEDG